LFNFAQKSENVSGSLFTVHLLVRETDLDILFWQQVMGMAHMWSNLVCHHGHYYYFLSGRALDEDTKIKPGFLRTRKKGEFLPKEDGPSSCFSD